MNYGKLSFLEYIVNERYQKKEKYIFSILSTQIKTALERETF